MIQTELIGCVLRRSERDHTTASRVVRRRDAGAGAPHGSRVSRAAPHCRPALEARARLAHAAADGARQRGVPAALGQPGKQWDNRAHFFAVAARVVRAVLVDHARARDAAKRGDGAVGVELSEEHASVDAPAVDVLDLDAALVELEAMDSEQSRIVELRYFAGLSIEETAEAMGTSPSSVKRGWLAAKTWIRRRLDGPTRPT